MRPATGHMAAMLILYPADVAWTFGTRSYPIAAAFLFNDRSIWSCSFASYSAIPLATYSVPYFSIR